MVPTKQSYRRETMADSFRYMAERLEKGRGFWERLPGGGWRINTNPEKCAAKRKELLEKAKSYMNYDSYIEGYDG